MLAVAVQMIVATVTKSFKETQTYLGLLPLLPSVPGMIMVFVPLQPTTLSMLVPTYGQTILIGQIVRGEGARLAHHSTPCPHHECNNSCAASATPPCACHTWYDMACADHGP